MPALTNHLALPHTLISSTRNLHQLSRQSTPAQFAKKVGAARRKFKIEPPEVEGDPEFIRTFRAQQNCVEFFGMFMCSLWVSGIFFHQVVAAVLGLVYLYARQTYFEGYAKDAKLRLPGFKLCCQALQGLLVASVLGLSNTIILAYTGFNAKAAILG